ncbi:YjbF family lipoprotein [Insolitispirillum peregrinum]|uniref:Group 4 capsule polysaccharide lipoprotein gfcB, YjbF n=1 Tax=Insolitispirillum peregrinum TaxID=80876 RepID=A0A1N7JH80_9PROT|nr:YjbF family lipoprotein [Insolitispirillum peregrinum]SIS48670.1 Group 4 capsule polysaccharide lipoprotein gfcB, YjbF [Insolitispirillum peregrinum]
MVISRRAFLAPLSGLMLSGCLSDNLQRLGRASEIITGNSGQAYDPQQARQLPYASMDVKLGISMQSLVILASVEGETLHWLTADKVTLSTRQGRVMATSGFPEDLLKTLPWGDDPILQRSPARGQTLRQIDLHYRSLYGLVVESDWEEQGLETVDTYGEVRTLNKVVERCRCRRFDWDFENTFWRDQRGFVWHSVQYFSPTAPPLQMRILKPYQG